ncbi:MAG TPA: type II/IV secretion system protein [Gemmatimonadales bacterium]|jgi:type II secretory ATPase GspE/PulE/Tfp pilus assembly ATPase PilB-like protein/CheY-like chemotaxis protein|nr:type II/IV secretion system protein [Gemmatimonadales bacterium]
MQFTDEWLVPSIETLLSDEAVRALREEEGPAVSLWEMLVQRKLASDGQILEAIASRFRFQVADLAQPDPKLVATVPEQLARRFNVVPVSQTDSYLEVATANPFDIDAEKMLAFATGREVRMLLGSPSKIREKLDELYRETETAVARLLEGFATDFDVQQLKDEEESAASAEQASQRPILRLVDTMIADGVTNRASDLHIEPVEGGIVVRYRIDGVLRQVMKIPRSAAAPLISRIKIMSGLDIADRLRPQDGRARVSVNGEPVDLRVSTLPASHGEKVVIRVLNQKATTLSLDSLGLAEDEQKGIRSLLAHKEGIILVTGPTGSGKTTTLYSALRAVQGTGVNIVTVEDPVEYRLGENIVQVQVNEKAGLTFASALRSILRQDPDVVLVGEIRDKETAQIALQASLTGHLVLSTLHTNDAPNTVTRLVDMGMEAYKIAPALRGIVAQRLMRRLCKNCCHVATEPVSERFERFIPKGVTLNQAVGCSECSMTGYRGRFSIVEVLTMSPELERRISDGASAEKIAEAARAAGMRTLWGSGLRHVLSGESAFEELLRVTDPPHEATTDTSAPAPPRKSGKGRTAAASPRPVSEEAEPVPEFSMDMELLEEPVVADGIPAGGRGKGASVLLVEDEEQLRRVMKDLLQREGYRVAEARDGIQALDEVDRFAPDVIILDLNLPGLDGYGVLAQLRSRPATREIPVMVLTAKGDEDNEVRVFELGADDFVTKPFRARSLTARLEAVLGRRRA